ncbi:uncharacterized protein BX664DRAFT_338110 [Halteromyces radiatus]|uniref:uncharacterized protein n=1 Tax=Halteromyces radiatus TaxID=101107 RepID=UPI00221FCD5E|nr:uncharacterized protein BX664DRAFT_338110 [Halteromyces radiatus]KAI8084920.1 hypothetical protein BX664DRAFT_338110 [Halteromyces radiatus]
MMHQASMASYLSAMYDPYIGTPAVEGMIQKRVPSTAPEAIQAVNDAEAALGYCRDEVLPELDGLDRDVTRPLLDLLDIAKTIQKTIVKRSHKLIDYDRHRLALAKLTAKQDRSFSEEKQIFKTETALDTATQDYEYLNNMLKEQLPHFFQLQSHFIQPVFERYYAIQVKIYGMIYARYHELFNANLNHFITNQMGIEDGFNYRKSQHDVRAEMENMDLLKSGGKAWLAASGGVNNSRLSLQERAALREQEKAGGMALSPPPAYGSSSSSPRMMNQYSTGQEKQQLQQQAWGPSSAPAPPAIANRTGGQYVIALYDYQAQADGDLSFRKDDKIELIERTMDQNDWWTGKLHGQTGIFPGNYVSEL